MFIISIWLAGYLSRGYSHIHQSISELGTRNTPHSWLVRGAGFIPLGLSFVLFALQTRDLFSSHYPSAIVFLTGLSTVMAGIFATDPHNRRDTLSSKVHAGSVIALLCLLTLAPFIFSISALYRTPPDGWFFVFSCSLGIFAVGFFGMLPSGCRRWLVALHQKLMGRFISSWYPLQGLHQRIFLSLHCIWWFVFSQVLIDA